jgi:hypothetical protein
MVHKFNLKTTYLTVMKNKLVLSLLAAAAVVLSSCGAPRVGALFTDISAPVTATSSGGSRVGTAQSQCILGLVATGDASIAAAKRNGGISTVSSVDEHVHSILGIITTYTTTVRGN